MGNTGVHNARPNAVVMLMGYQAGHVHQIASTISEVLFGDADRIIEIDLGTASLSTLVGTPSGHVEYNDPFPMQRIVETPWCVLCLENIDEAHPEVRQVVKEALRGGYLTDTDGRRMFFSEAVVLLTTGGIVDSRAAIGFRQSPGSTEDDNPRESARRALDPVLVAQCDIGCSEPTGRSRSPRGAWFEDRVLKPLAKRYEERGVILDWDADVLNPLCLNLGEETGAGEWERLLEGQLGQLIIPYIPIAGGGEVVLTIVVDESGNIQIRQKK